MALRDEPWRREPDRYPFRATLQTRYGDQDTNAHLNNVAIARLFEEARLRFHARLRASGAAVDPGGVMIAHLSIDYVAQGHYPGDVEARVGVAATGTRSYRLAAILLQQERAFALAECVMVHRDRLGRETRAQLDPWRITGPAQG
ncbi:acyl-CoA thioesterase [Thermaurantiacus sp.]